MGITTLNDTYLLEEVKLGFSELKLGDTTVKQREFEGTDYNSFSNRCFVKYTPINSQINEGEEVIVSHFVIDNTIQIGEDVYLIAKPEEIFGIKVNNDYDITSKDYIRCFKPFNGFLGEPYHDTPEGNFKSATTNETASESNYLVDLDGVEIEFLDFADYEVFVNEKRYSFVPYKDCFTIDGVLNEDYFTLYTEDMIIINESHVYETKSGIKVIRYDNLVGRQL